MRVEGMRRSRAFAEHAFSGAKSDSLIRRRRKNTEVITDITGRIITLITHQLLWRYLTLSQLKLTHHRNTSLCSNFLLSDYQGFIQDTETSPCFKCQKAQQDTPDLHVNSVLVSQFWWDTSWLQILGELYLIFLLIPQYSVKCLGCCSSIIYLWCFCHYWLQY